jgi:CRISPR-associated protein Cas1
MTSSHQNNASDPVNMALNYGYDFLEGECRRAINAVGLEPAVGFLHDFGDYQTKQSLVYDLQEPFRWLVDVSAVDAFESGALDLPEFYFTGDDYRYRFDSNAKQRFVDLIRVRFNEGIGCNGRTLRWDTVMEKKANELGRFLTKKSNEVDFVEPALALHRDDAQELRAKILALTTLQAKQLGIEKSTLHYLRAYARSQKTIKVHANTSMRLQPLRNVGK